MHLQDTIFLVNFLTNDFADIMMMEDDENNDEGYSTSEIEHIESLLKEKNLSLKKLDGIQASIVHIGREFKIQFLGYDELYTLSLLEFIDRNIFFKIMAFFKEPKQVKIINPSPQVGGIIDTNYGVKFNIEII